MQRCKKKSIPLPLKSLVWNKIIGEEKGIGNCYCCKTKIRQISFHCGHIVSEKNGGPTVVDNLVPLCQMCNSSVGTQNLNDFMKKYNLQNNKPFSNVQKNNVPHFINFKIYIKLCNITKNDFENLITNHFQKLKNNNN